MDQLADGALPLLAVSCPVVGLNIRSFRGRQARSIGSVRRNVPRFFREALTPFAAYQATGRPQVIALGTDRMFVIPLPGAGWKCRGAASGADLRIADVLTVAHQEEDEGPVRSRRSVVHARVRWIIYRLGT